MELLCSRLTAQAIMSCLTIIPRSKESPLSWHLSKVQVWNGLYDLSRAQVGLGMEEMLVG